MSLQFVYGRSGSGKSEYMLKRASILETEGRRILMIVPEQYSHQGESAFLKEKGYICDTFNVTSFARFAKKIIGNVKNKKTLDSAGKAMMTLKAVSSCRDKLLYYKASCENQGYIKLFMDAISEFKKGGVTPDMLFSASRIAEEKSFSARLNDLALILEEYNKFISYDFLDADDDLILAAGCIKENAEIKETEIFIDEFFRFTQNEIILISSFLAVGASVTISIPMPVCPAKSSVFKSCEYTKDVITKIANDLGAKILPPVILEESKRHKSQELICLEKATSGERVMFDKETKDISLYVAKGRYEEVIYTAAAIRKYVAQNDALFNEIAIITGDYDGYSDLVKSVFEMYDLPIFLDSRREFLSHPIVLYLFSVFDLLSGISTEKVVSYMKSGFADITEDEAFRLENYALSGAIEYNDWLSDERFIRKARGIFSQEQSENKEGEKLVGVKNKLFAPILALKEKITKSKSALSRINAIVSFLDATGFQEKIEKKASDFRKKNMGRNADEYAEVYNILMETLGMMAEVLGDKNIGLSGIRGVLEAGLSQKSIGVIPSVYDSISYGDLNRSVIKNVRALFVLGANDEIFPPMAQTGVLLSDSERDFLNLNGVWVAPNTKKRIADGEFSVYSAVNTPREKLFVSYPVSDDNGTGLRPAMFISKLKRVFPKLKIESDLQNDEQGLEVTVASKQSAYTYLLTHIDKINVDKTITAIYDFLSCDSEYKEKLKTAIAYSKYKNTAGRLSDETIIKLYGNTLYGSVSRFERYSACPFSFFIEHGLKAKERKVLKIEAPDMGSLLHEIIERFSLEIYKRGLSFKTIEMEEQREITDRITDELLGLGFIKNMYSEGRLSALSRRLKSLVSKSVWAICSQARMGDFEPSHFEASFDINGNLPPVKVLLPDGGEIIMRGRIDRIDTLAKDGKLYVKIIDYKSGSKGYSLSDIFNGTTLQLAVYTVAATEGLAKNSAFGGMFYFKLNDPVFEGMPDAEADDVKLLKTFKMSGLSTDDVDVIRAMDNDFSGWSSVIPVYLKADGTVSKASSKTASNEQFETLKKYIKNTVSKIGQEILKGNVDISPVRDGDFSPCTYCIYASVCGFDPNEHRCRMAKKFESDDEIWEEMKSKT